MPSNTSTPGRAAVRDLGATRSGDHRLLEVPVPESAQQATPRRGGWRGLLAAMVIGQSAGVPF